MTRAVSSLVAVLALSASAHASDCPVLSPTQRTCQEAVAKADAGYAKSAIAAIQKCLQAVQSGAIPGDPATVCLGTPPGDAVTATKLQKAADKVALTIPRKCSDPDIASLALCAPTAGGLATCLVSGTRARLGAALAAEYGTLVANPDKGIQKCQQTLGKESGKFLTGTLKVIQKCLNTRNKKVCGTTSPLLRCLAPQPMGPKDEAKAAGSLAKAEIKLRDKIAKSCTDPQLAALDACGSTVGDVQSCLVCAHGNAASLLAGGQYRTVRTATPASTFQAAADAADAEDTILLEPGAYVEEVILKDSGLSVLGLADCGTGGRAVVTPPSPASFDGVSHCGSRLPGCTEIADDVLFQGFEVNDFLENDIYSVGVDGVTYRDMITRGPGNSSRTRYGLFPVQSRNVLIEGSVATGINDAALYVGQSIDIVIRDNEVYGNVAGLEVENSANAEVYGNHAHDNAAGILVFKLAGLPVQTSDCHYIHDNRSENNNGPNFGSSGIISILPSGIGMLVLSNDGGVFENNVVVGNKSIGLSVVDQQVVNVLFSPPPFPSPSPDQDVNDNALVGSTITGNGFDPDSAIGAFAADVVFAPLAASGNCQNGNTFATDLGNAFAGLPACPTTYNPRPGCPFVPPTTTTTTTTPTTTTTSSTLPWTWSAEVQPLLSTRCAGCHGNSGTPQYAGFANIQDPVLGYANIVSVTSVELPTMARIEPGDHLQSYLWHKINGSQLSVGGSGVRMPQFGPFLDAAELDGIAGWIDAGALND